MIAVRVVLAISLAAVLASPAAAAYRMCAFRQGPSGPCTCKLDKDGPGQFSIAPRSRCKSYTAPKEEAKQDAPEAPAAVAPAGEPAAPQTATPSAAAEAPTGAAATPAATAPGASEGTGAPVPAAAMGTGSLPARLDEVRTRGKLLCGVNTKLLGFSAQSPAGSWTGLDVDFCRAMAAAVLGANGKVEFVPVETADRFDALKSGKVDVLSRNTTWTMAREVDLGLAFAGVLYFDGQGFLTRDDRGLVSAQQLSGLTVCVEANTTSETNMAFYFKTHQVEATTKTFATREEMVKSYQDGTCDAYSADRSALYSDRAGFSDPTQHAILPEVISKEPLGPAVLQADREWSEIAHWTLAGLVNAEEVGLDKASAAASGALSEDAQRLMDGAAASGAKLRLTATWLRDAVATVGNYGEVFEANLGKSSPLGMSRGINALWKRGGILYAPPMW